MMTKIYNIISLNLEMFLVEEFQPKTDFPYICLEKLNTGEWNLWQVDDKNDWDYKTQVNIIASTNKKLKLPLIPENFYSKDNMRDMYFAGLIDAKLFDFPDDDQANVRFNDQLANLKNNPPIAAEVEMEEVIVQPYFDADPHQYTIQKPKITEDNQIIIKQWIYER